MSIVLLKRTLETTTPDIARNDRVNKGIARLAFPVYWALYCVCAGMVILAAIALLHAEQTGVWHGFWSKMRSFFWQRDSALTYLLIANSFRYVSYSTQSSLRIREAALAADDHVAPLAEIQPDGRLAPDLPGEPVSVGALRRPHRGRADTRRFAGCLIAGIFGALGMLMLVLLIAVNNLYARLGFAAGLTAFALLAVRFVWLTAHIRRNVTVWASAHRLEWETEKRDTAAWNDVQAFLTYAFHDSKTYADRAIFAVETHHGMLTWEIRGDASEEERRTHDRLCRVVVRYAGQPLRDLSNSEKTLWDEEPDSDGDRPQPGEPEGMPVVRNPHTDQDRERHRDWGCLAALALFGAMLLLALAGVILQHV